MLGTSVTQVVCRHCMGILNSSFANNKQIFRVLCGNYAYMCSVVIDAHTNLLSATFAYSDWLIKKRQIVRVLYGSL